MRLAIPLISLALVACGGSSAGTTTEAPVNLTSSGVSSPAITIPNGGRVHFFNKDTVDHEIVSTNCSVLSSKRLTPGTDDLRPQMTGPLSCTYSDSLTSSAAFSGSVQVSAAGTGGGGGGY